MRTATIVSVTPNKQLELPEEIQQQLKPGDEYLIWQTEDSITFKKVQKPRTYSDLLNKIQALEPNQNEPSIEEICEIVKEVRH
jgi:hypothetical protein